MRRPRLRSYELAGAIAATLCALTLAAQTGSPPLAGDYTGMLVDKHLVVHILPESAGTLTGKLTCTLDLPNEHQYYEGGLPCANLTLSDPEPNQELQFDVPTLQGHFQGRRSSDAKTITGTWTRNGKTVALVLNRDPFEPAEKPSPVDGDWQGVLDANVGPVPITLHVKSDRSGKEYVTLDAPATPNGFGIPMVHATGNGELFSFDSSLDQSHYGGKLSEDGKTISGVWEGNGELSALVLRRPEPAAKPSLVDGDWTEMLETPNGPLHALLQIASDRAGNETAVFSSPDQHARHLDTANVALRLGTLSFDVPSIHGSYTGRVSEDGNSIAGAWKQSQPSPLTLPLNFQRGVAGSAGDRQTPADPPQPPMTLAELHTRLDSELKPLVENPAFAGLSGIGVAIGIYKRGERAVWTYGTATPDSLFEIGAVTQTFTGLILARMVAGGAVSLDTPVRELLPSGVVAKPAGPEITLESLATFHSSTQHLLDGFHPADPANPVAGFTLNNLNDALAKTGVALKPNAPFDSSNSGIAILGEALASKAGLTYEALLRREVLDPFNLRHTFLTVPAAEKSYLLTGHDYPLNPMHAWDYDAMAPVGGLHSNIGDMLTYAAAQLDPPASLAPAVALEHQLRAVTDDGARHLFRIGLTWMFEPDPKNYFSVAATGGFSAYLFFNKEQQIAGVVLTNRVFGAENIGYRIEGLMEGRRAYPLVR